MKNITQEDLPTLLQPDRADNRQLLLVKEFRLKFVGLLVMTMQHGTDTMGL